MPNEESRIVRIALCQLESHPALSVSHVNYLEEPFVPLPEGVSLSQLSAKGLDVDPLFQHCLDKYSSWSHTRLSSVLDALDRIPQPPDLVIFPEGAVSLFSLSTITEWTKRNSNTVLAGTHTPMRTPEALAAYSKIGIRKGQIDRIALRGVRNIVPLVRSGKTKLIEKTKLSPFERDIIPNPKGHKSLAQPQRIGTACGEFLLQPLICADALSHSYTSSKANLLAILSYDAKSPQFDDFMNYHVRNRTPVIFVNDGAYGGSRIVTVEDRRQTNWLGDVLPAGLPSGDHILVADLNLDVTAVEVGTSNPGVPLELVKLESVVASNSSGATIARELADIRKLDDTTVKTARLGDILKTLSPSELHRLRIEHLHRQEKRGLPSEHVWNVIGDDWVVVGMETLAELEANLSAICKEYLLENGLKIGTRGNDVNLDVVTYISECQKRSKGLNLVPEFEAVQPATVIDRESEVETLSRHLTDRSTILIPIVGLTQVGKTQIVAKTLAELGLTRIRRISLRDTSSPEFIARMIVAHTTKWDESFDLNTYLHGPEIRRELANLQVLWFENAEQFVEYGVWRDEKLREFFETILALCEDSKTKIIIEATRDLPIDLDNPNIRRRVRIKGLQDRYSIRLLDQHLRQLNLEADILPEEDKRQLVGRLGGHPMGIVFAADAVFDIGPSSVLRELRGRRGLLSTFLGRVVRQLQLSDEEHTTLQLLTLARDEIPRQVISETRKATTIQEIRNLTALSAVEIDRFGNIRIAPILREYFDSGDLPSDEVERFHRAASTAFAEMSRQHHGDLHFAVESEFHAHLANVPAEVVTGLIDSSLATAKRLYAQQGYQRASRILESLRERTDRTEVLRISALVEARCNRLDLSLKFASIVFERNRNDTRLLTELARIALTQSQDHIAEKLIDIATKARVEDVSILIIEGRMMLRRNDLRKAEEVFQRALELTTRNPWPFFYLGRIYLNAGKLDEAIDVLYEGEKFAYENGGQRGRALNAIRTQLGIAYLLSDRLDLAGSVIEGVVADNPKSPEAIRAYAALTIRRDGVERAHTAWEELRKGKIRNRHDRCQFHLFYGLFFLAVGDINSANREFGHAHTADRQNVYVMMNLAKTLFEIAKEMKGDGIDGFMDYARDALALVRKIFEFDSENRIGVDLMVDIRAHFDLEI